MSNPEEAVNALVGLGLTEYEARCFVALTRLSSGTAKEVSQVADVPRSRVYDTIERLNQKGLVAVQQSEPRKYRAVSVETACQRIGENYDSRLNAAENALHQVEEPKSTEEEGMWAISQSTQVTDRVCTFLDGAEQTIHHLIATEDVLDRRILEGLNAACDRGVSVFIEVPTDDVQERLRDAVPNATVVVSESLQTTNTVYSESPGQLLVVDRGPMVVAGVREGTLPDVTQETAVWTYGRDHGVAAWTLELLDHRTANR